jgi:hypothetical protein
LELHRTARGDIPWRSRVARLVPFGGEGRACSGGPTLSSAIFSVIRVSRRTRAVSIRIRRPHRSTTGQADGHKSPAVPRLAPPRVVSRHPRGPRTGSRRRRGWMSERRAAIQGGGIRRHPVSLPNALRTSRDADAGPASRESQARAPRRRKPCSALDARLSPIPDWSSQGRDASAPAGRPLAKRDAATRGRVSATAGRA